MLSISLRSTSSEGGAGGGFDMEVSDEVSDPHPEERRLRRVSNEEGPFCLMVRNGARALAQHEAVLSPVNHSPVLTKSPARTSFNPFRGHLSRPACSHVKQLAKQAGDRSDPGRTLRFRPGFLWPDFRGGPDRPSEEVGNKMVNVKSIPSPAIHADERSQEADHPSSQVALFGADQPLPLDCGIDLTPFQIAYQTYGELNADKSNAILVCHALTGDQHVANIHPVTGKPGWWETMVGPGRPLDTDSYFIICANVIGGCMGSTGPASTNPATGKLWGLDFPIITIPDMVRAQAMLLDRLGIDTLFSVVGRSMGGMQALPWPPPYPPRAFSVLPVPRRAR